MNDWFIEQKRSAFAVYAGVIFDEDDTDSFNYEIRTLFSKSAQVDGLVGLDKNCRNGSLQCPSQDYLSNGFLELQMEIDRILLRRTGVIAPRYSTQMMPKEGYVMDSSEIRAFAPVFYVFTYSFFLQVSEY